MHELEPIVHVKGQLPLDLWMIKEAKKGLKPWKIYNNEGKKVGAFYTKEEANIVMEKLKQKEVELC